MSTLQQQNLNNLRDLHLIELNNNESEDVTKWVVTLSNGLVVYEEPLNLEKKSWLCLKEFCRINDLYIVDFILKFRSHHERIYPEDAAGYFFSYGIYGIVGENRSYNQYVVGTLNNRDDKFVNISKWLVPELIVVDTDSRPIEKCKDLMIFKSYG